MKVVKQSFKYAFLIIAAAVSLFPFLWMILGATNSTTDILQGRLLPGAELINNFKKLIDMANLGDALLNSAIIAVASTGLLLLIASSAGYAFEIFKTKGKERVYTGFMLAMMIPFAAIMIPLFRMFAGANMADTLIAVILPTIATPFMVFFFRQNTKSFSRELLEAARIDGLSERQAFFHIYVPTMRSTYAAAGIIAFMTSWNNFLWPLIILQSEAKKTITLVISSLSSAYFPEYGAIMVAIVIATLPTIAIFFLLQRHFVQGMLGSVK